MGTTMFELIGSSHMLLSTREHHNDADDSNLTGFLLWCALVVISSHILSELIRFYDWNVQDWIWTA
jgi:hypothetical protein